MFTLIIHKHGLTGLTNLYLCLILVHLPTAVHISYLQIMPQMPGARGENGENLVRGQRAPPYRHALSAPIGTVFIMFVEIFLNFRIPSHRTSHPVLDSVTTTEKLVINRKGGFFFFLNSGNP